MAKDVWMVGALALYDSGCAETAVFSLYFTAPKRLSNELVDTIGAEPET